MPPKAPRSTAYQGTSLVVPVLIERLLNSDRKCLLLNHPMGMIWPVQEQDTVLVSSIFGWLIRRRLLDSMLLRL